LPTNTKAPAPARPPSNRTVSKARQRKQTFPHPPIETRNSATSTSRDGSVVATRNDKKQKQKTKQKKALKSGNRRPTTQGV